MQQRVRSAVAVLVLSVVCLACGGGGHGGGPTEPSGQRLQVTLIAVPVGGNLLEAAVSFDGREVSRVDWSRTGGSCALFCGLAVDVAGISAGEHTIRFTVVRQTRATVDYFVNYGGVLTDPATGRQDPVNSPQQSVRLQAGQSASFTLRV